MASQQDVMLRVAAMIGDSIAVDTQDGERVFEQVRDCLKSGGNVTLSFEGVEFVIVAFLNVAIGKLYGDFSEEAVRENFRVEHLKPEDVVKLKRAIENGKACYGRKAPGLGTAKYPAKCFRPVA
jgi:hypothetical protein